VVQFKLQRGKLFEMSEAFGKNWQDSVAYMEAVVQDLHASGIEVGETRPDKVFALAECYRRCDRHLYTAFLYGRLAKEMNAAGLLVCAARAIEHVEAAAKLLNRQVDAPTMDLLSQRVEVLPMVTVYALREEIHQQLRRTIDILKKKLPGKDMTFLSTVKAYQDKAERAATLLGDSALLEATMQQKGSIYTEVAAEEVFGPNEGLDEVSQMDKLLCALNFSEDELRGLMEEVQGPLVN
jgi:hypothetical protein